MVWRQHVGDGGDGKQQRGLRSDSGFAVRETQRATRHDRPQEPVVGECAERGTCQVVNDAC